MTVYWRVGRGCLVIMVEHDGTPTGQDTFGELLVVALRCTVKVSPFIMAAWEGGPVDRPSMCLFWCYLAVGPRVGSTCARKPKMRRCVTWRSLQDGPGAA